MRLLLDTHALLWGLLDDSRLSSRARAAIDDADNDIVVSAVSLFEVTLKHRLGKLDEVAIFAAHHRSIMADLGWTPLSVSIKHASLAGSLDIPHKDPFDRLLIAQAMVEDLPFVSNEAVFDGFGVTRLW